METIRFAIQINAPVQKVWQVMLDHPTYEEWAGEFNAGSTYVGNWDKGSAIRFIALNDEGKEEGMLSRIKENKGSQYISIEHYGVILNGIEDTSSEEVRNWAPSLENYTFSEQDGKTNLAVDMEVTEEYKSMFEEMWPRALNKLKEICERS